MPITEFQHKLIGLRETMRTFTWRFTRNKEESNDLLQDTILRALTYSDRFREETNLKGWLYTIMRNTFINGYRKKIHQPQTIRQATKDEYYLHVGDTHTFNLPDKKFEYDDIWRNVHRIEDELLIPFKMYTSGYKYHEIAAHLNIPVGTVKNRLFHARKKIQKNLVDY